MLDAAAFDKGPYPASKVVEVVYKFRAAIWGESVSVHLKDAHFLVLQLIASKIIGIKVENAPAGVLLKSHVALSWLKVKPVLVLRVGSGPSIKVPQPRRPAYTDERRGSGISLLFSVEDELGFV